MKNRTMPKFGTWQRMGFSVLESRRAVNSLCVLWRGSKALENTEAIAEHGTCASGVEGQS